MAQISSLVWSPHIVKCGRGTVKEMCHHWGAWNSYNSKKLQKGRLQQWNQTFLPWRRAQHLSNPTDIVLFPRKSSIIPLVEKMGILCLRPKNQAGSIEKWIWLAIAEFSLKLYRKQEKQYLSNRNIDQEFQHHWGCKWSISSTFAWRKIEVW